MTTQELRAAAERIMKIVHDCGEPRQYPVLSDMVALARAWLAEHPADDEEPAVPGIVYDKLDRRIEVMISAPGELSAYLEVIVQRGTERFKRPDEPVRLCTVETSGDVRRLLIGLGITEDRIS